MSIDIALKLSVPVKLSRSTDCYGENEKSCGALYVIIDVSERKKNLWYNKNYHNITERGFICTTARN